jgi:hypothetical protein
LTLALDKPEVVVTERVVQAEPTDETAELSADNLENLRRLHAETTGEDEPWTVTCVTYELRAIPSP